MKIEAEWMRGGTSKCWVFETETLNETSIDLDELLPRLFGSPDSRQIDGVGGATSTTSKAMILRRPSDPSVDVEFTFAQVGIEEATVDWGSNCGNCSAVVGLYAIEKGWVTPKGDTTRIVTRNTNTGQLIIQQVATPSGALPIVPDAHMPGVAFPGFKVGLGFQDPAGKTTGELLPTGTASETVLAAWEILDSIDGGCRLPRSSSSVPKTSDSTYPATTRGRNTWSSIWKHWTPFAARQQCAWGWQRLLRKQPAPYPSWQSSALPAIQVRTATSTS